jgi:hypothetical protein
MEKIIMKTVLAELHELINDLEDQGLTVEASTLQEVFVKVAEDMADEDGMDEPVEDDDLAKDVARLLKSHSPAEVLAEIAKQMGGESDGMDDDQGDDQTSSFANVVDDGGHHPAQESDWHSNPEVMDNATFYVGEQLSKQEVVSKYSNKYITSKGLMSLNDLAEQATAEFGDVITPAEIARGQANYDYAAEASKYFAKNPNVTKD